MEKEQAMKTCLRYISECNKCFTFIILGPEWRQRNNNKICLSDRVIGKGSVNCKKRFNAQNRSKQEYKIASRFMGLWDEHLLKEKEREKIH